MAHKGWVKLHHRILDSAVWQNPNLYRLCSWILLKASHKPHDVIIRGQVVHLEPGQLVYGRDRAVAETGLSSRTTRSSLKNLKKLGIVTIRATNRFSLITVVNWAKYQESPDASDQQNDQQASN